MKKKITRIAIATIVLALCNVLLANYLPLSLCCTLFLLQNVLLPAISTSYLIDISKQRYYLGALIGAITGFVPTTTMILVSVIRYYFLGEKQLLEDVTGQTLPVTTEIFLAGIAAYLFVWIFLILVSSMSGFFAAYRKAKKLSKSVSNSSPSLFS